MRLLVLSTRSLSAFQVSALEPVADSARIELVGACVDDRPDASPARRLRAALGRGRGGFALVLAARRLRPLRREAAPVSAGEFFARHRVPVLAVTDLYGEEALSFIGERRPDAIFRSGFGIIREPILSLPPMGVLSYHHGDMRAYRGIPPAFWELYNGERRMGVTVQVLAEALDAGAIVTETTVPIHPRDGLRALTERAYASSAGMLHEACLILDQGGPAPGPLPPEQLGRLYTMPTLRQWLALQGKVAWRRLRNGGG